jgi:beta-lactamase class A
MEHLSSSQILQNAIAEISRIGGYAEGVVGVSAFHLESGAAVRYQDAKPLPLASTVKLPLALHLLEKVERGELSLDDMITIEDSEITPLGVVGTEFLHPGISLSIANLLEPTITRSDNTTTDVLFRVVGGTASVQHYLHRIGLSEMNVSRTMRQALCIMHDIDLPNPRISMRDALAEITSHQLEARSRTSPPDMDYRHSERDLATPRSMLELLRRLWSGEVLGDRYRNLLIGMMTRTSISPARIRARLPQGVTVANKTGSGSGTSNDVGYLILPDNRGTIALVIYLSCSPLSMDAREGVIADIARLIYDYFILTANPIGAFNEASRNSDNATTNQRQSGE